MMGNRGQGVLMTVLLLGVLMATVIIFGAKRQADVAALTGRLDAGQTAAEVLSAATKRVQNIYANEASCDPTSLNSRISNLSKIGTNPNALGFGTSGLAFAVAQAGFTGAGGERFNICSPVATGAGCRQIAVNLENYIYVVTVGNVVAMNPTNNDVPGGDCPQDVSVHLSVAIGGSVYNQWSTLINVCTFRSCNHKVTGANTDAGDPASNTPSSFDGVIATVPGGALTTSACVTSGAVTIPSHYYGVMTDSANAKIYADDVRWARKYLETGGASVGDVSNLFAAAGNIPGACVAGTSSGQCVGKDCVPAFDLNMDRTNSETDLGILELYMRGYMLSLPVTNLR